MNKGAESLSSGNQPVSESRHRKVKKAWRLRQLWRKLNSEEASLVSTNRLLELLKTQPQDASICIDWSGKSDGSVNVILEAVGVNDSFGLRVKMCVWLGVSRGLDLAFLNAD